MQLTLIGLALAATIASAQTVPLQPCQDLNFPACNVVQLQTPEDPYASYRVPKPPTVPKWTAFVKSLSDESTYPWTNLAAMPGPADGGATPGAANAKGAAWGTIENAATEVYTCPAGKWALTFDDGPVLTDRSLAILKANKVVGTYFLVGSAIVNNATHAQYVKDIYDNGHQIALHSWSHRPISLQSTDAVISELILNILAIYKVIGKVPRYYRPAYSAIDDRVRYILKSMGLRPVIWNIESLDAAVGTAAPAGIEISGIVTVDMAVSHVKTIFKEKTDPRWNYFPGTPDATGRNTYQGFISLEHDINDDEIRVAEQVVAFAAQSGFESVYVNACDQIMPGADFYLHEDSALVQFIKTINLPLTAADLEPFTGTFTANPAGGAAVGGVVATGGGAVASKTGSAAVTATGGAAATSTKSSGLRSAVALVASAISFLFM
ncbi:chitin deacetylase [Chytriomyces hyalinus]|nr:chitin deacetylase [Chytriomyces hyalinus]